MHAPIGVRGSIAVLGILVFAGGSPLCAQVAQEARVAEAIAAVEVWLDAQRAYEQIPSFSAAIVHDQEIVWSGVQGMAHPERGVAATRETLYSICSISKLFTSISLMRLRDEGLVELSDPVAKHLPWFTLSQQHQGSDDVTIEGILTHSAGLPREADYPYWTGPDFPFPTHDEIVSRIPEQETLYPAWKYFQYSNLGLTLAGEIVAQRSGMPYADYVRRNVLEPLGLSNTFPEIPEEHRGGRLATGYSGLTREGRRDPVAFFQAKGIAPAAGFASTAEDLARFAAWQFRLEGAREEVLRAHTLAEMQRVQYVDPSFNTYWGLGFSIQRRDDRTFVGHGGSCPGFRSNLALQKDDRIATVFMANAMVNANAFTSGMYDLVREAITDAAKRNAESAATDGDVEPEAQQIDLSPYLGLYNEHPWGGETAAIRWKGGLALLSLPTENPLRAITRLRHEGGDTFRVIRPDDEPGEAIVFERDASGQVTGIRRFAQFSARLR